MISKEMQVYEIIDETAGSNAFVQGVSGVAGFPFTMIVDGATIFTHYGAMLNQIRTVYGRTPMSVTQATPILKSIMSELFADIVIDKVIGNIPIVGIGANYIAAKAMTWRLGILFGILAAKGETMDEQLIDKAVTAVRTMFPYQDSIFVKKPSCSTVEKLLKMSENVSDASLDQKLDAILSSLVD